MKVGFLSLCIIFLAFLISCQESLTERCAREAKEYTFKNCPAKIANEMTLDSVTFTEEGNILGYYYCVSGILDSLEYMQSNEKTFRDLMKTEIKNSTQMRAYKEAGFSFEYIYLSKKNHKRLLTLHFVEKDYK